MADATIVSTTKFTNQSLERVFSISSVATITTSAEYGLPIEKTVGNIWSYSIGCSSTDFDVILKEQSGVGNYSPYEILRREDNNLGYGESGVVVPFNTATEKLYVTIINNDATNATGVISIKLRVGN